VPQEPPHPSGPQVLPVQLGVHAAFDVMLLSWKPAQLKPPEETSMQ
jgi:hypothetical protein